MVSSIVPKQIGKTHLQWQCLEAAIPRTASRAKSDPVTAMAANAANVRRAANGLIARTKLPATMQRREKHSRLWRALLQALLQPTWVRKPARPALLVPPEARLKGQHRRGRTRAGKNAQ